MKVAGRRGGETRPGRPIRQATFALLAGAEDMRRRIVRRDGVVGSALDADPRRTAKQAVMGARHLDEQARAIETIAFVLLETGCFRQLNNGQQRVLINIGAGAPLRVVDHKLAPLKFPARQKSNQGRLQTHSDPKHGFVSADRCCRFVW